MLYTDTPWLQVPFRELGSERRDVSAAAGGVVAAGLFEEAIRLLQGQLAEAEKLDWSRVIMDASLVEAKKGARRSRARSAARPAAGSSS